MGKLARKPYLQNVQGIKNVTCDFDRIRVDSELDE